MKKQDGRKLLAEVQEALRLRIAGFLKSQKGTQGQAADIFQISLRAVKKIWKQYKEGGMQALKAKKRGRPQSTGRLSKAKQKEITRSVKAATPEHYRIASSLWTAGAVRLLIKKKPG